MRIGHVCSVLVATVVFFADARAEACSCTVATNGTVPVDAPSGPEVSMLDHGEVANGTTSIASPAVESNTRRLPQAGGGCGFSVRKTSGGVFAVFGFLLAALVKARSVRRST
jgi:hypothetical protein